MKKWKVYENGFFAGETEAPSAAKAINNVRFRLYGRGYCDKEFSAVEVKE